MSVVEELPFGWDDGEFISPFVVTSEEDSSALADWIWLRVCTSLETAGKTGATPQRAHISLVDLGCGDGTALMNTVKHLSSCASTGPSPLAGGALTVTVTGIDLDDALIEEAQQRAKDVPTVVSTTGADGSLLKVSLRFESGDIRQFDVEDLFPILSEQDDVSAHSNCDVRVLFVYLLPEAIEQLRDTLETIVKSRKWLLVSNRWPVPFLSDCLVESPSHLHIYQFKA